jgi:hypothetical protein
MFDLLEGCGSAALFTLFSQSESEQRRDDADGGRSERKKPPRFFALSIAIMLGERFQPVPEESKEPCVPAAAVKKIYALTSPRKAGGDFGTVQAETDECHSTACNCRRSDSLEVKCDTGSGRTLHDCRNFRKLVAEIFGIDGGTKKYDYLGVAVANFNLAFRRQSRLILPRYV